ncbi:MAG: DUF6455 family protein [Burkholderiales bacterium]
MDEFPIVLVDAGDPLLLIGLAWLAILSMLAWALVAEVWHLLRGRERVLLMHMLEHNGLTLQEAVQAEGYEGLVHAVDRCFDCNDRRACRRSLRWAWLGAREPRCPNAELFAHALQAHKVRNPEAAT